METMMRVVKACIYFSILFTVTLGQDIFVDVSQGTLLGTTVHYKENHYLNVDKTFHVFYGIPFVLPPIGNRRFNKPVPMERWEGIWNATYRRSRCLQLRSISDADDKGDEDCLHLNVFAPAQTTGQLPVMVWIHGGGYFGGQGGSAFYLPYPLMSMGEFVFVSINYRLGIYGFLTTGDEASVGNYGIYDQIEALKWIQTNIAAFGGNPDEVTIAGESAGAGSAGILGISPLATGLFKRLIMQSGSSVAPWAVDFTSQRGLMLARQAAGMLNCDESDTFRMVTCLREAPAEELTSAQNAVLIDSVINQLPYVPVVDGVLIPDKPLYLLKSRQFKNVDILIGSNKDEGDLLALRAYPTYIIRDRPPFMSYDEFRTRLRDYVYFYNHNLDFDAIEQQYVDHASIDTPGVSFLPTFSNIITDQAFACPALSTALFYSLAGNNVYSYQMTHEPSWTIFLGDNGPAWVGAIHGEDIQFVFGWEMNPVMKDRANLTEEEVYMSVQVMRYWANFVISGNPNTPNQDGYQYERWPSYSESTKLYKTLSLNFDNGEFLKENDCHFWNYQMPRQYMFTGKVDEVWDEWRRETVRWKESDFETWKTENEIYEQSKSNCKQ
ncbi:cholinesterase-like [Apostichopus japonicus]|uniref:cholinesterase-like n=1 Tax=Stichopus japonicus TaxID=307972 RepID=UPI003AB751AC